ncbi:hypothetical protein HOE49_04765 [Candidatus Peregrinibacteria bacterium]|nr:hypothetical protein [Candidatus Peregrinibacteria bacterium]
MENQKSFGISMREGVNPLGKHRGYDIFKPDGELKDCKLPEGIEECRAKIGGAYVSIMPGEPKIVCPGECPEFDRDMMKEGVIGNTNQHRNALGGLRREGRDTRKDFIDRFQGLASRIAELIRENIESGADLEKGVPIELGKIGDELRIYDPTVPLKGTGQKEFHRKEKSYTGMLESKIAWLLINEYGGSAKDLGVHLSNTHSGKRVFVIAGKNAKKIQSRKPMDIVDPTIL